MLPALGIKDLLDRVSGLRVRDPISEHAVHLPLFNPCLV